MSQNTAEDTILELVQMLRSKEAKRRESTARTIGLHKIVDPRIVRSLLILALTDPVSYVRTSAANTLSMLGVNTPSLGDWLKLGQVEFLVDTTADWSESAERRKPYLAQLDMLRASLSAPTATPAPVRTGEPATAPAPARPVESPAPVARTAEAAPRRRHAESVPFDQWLLSERNIKIALYTGGILLIMAGLIFIGVNWALLPGLVKLGITLAVTALMYTGGILLYRRPSLRIGGVALLVVASGFAPLNFVVLHIYLLAARQVTWASTQMVASLVCLIVYAVTASRTRHTFFTYLALAAFAAGIAAAIDLLRLDASAAILVYALAAFAVGLTALAVRRRSFAGFVSQPLLVTANLAAPVLFLSAAAAWVNHRGCPSCEHTPVWFLFLAMLTIVAHYVTTDWFYRQLAARWAAAFLLALTVIFFLTELGLSSITTGILLKGLALLYLLAGYALMGGRGKRVEPALPLFTVGFGLAAFVTCQALAQVTVARDQLALALLADVALLVVSAILFRGLPWVFGAVWLFIAPFFLYATLYLPQRSEWGLALGALMLIYAAVGYIVGRRALKFGAAFLSAAAFLSLVVPLLTAPDWALTSSSLLVIAVGYLLVALWRRWPWLLLASLSAVNLALLTFTLIYMNPGLPWARVLTCGFAALGVVLILSGMTLKATRHAAWRLPLYVVAFLDLIGAYYASIWLDLYTQGSALDRILVVSLSVVMALFAWTLGWVERKSLKRLGMPRVLSYAAPALLFVAFFYLVRLVLPSSPYSMALVVSFCGLLVVGRYLVRGAPWRELYGEPLRTVGLALLVVPLADRILHFDPLPTAVAFVVGSFILLGDALVRRDRYQFYLGGGLLTIVIWSLLRFRNVTEFQAYAIPPGLGLLLVGWNERQHEPRASYQFATLLGLLILMGSAFVQSFDQTRYAVLLFGESLAAFGVGVKLRSRRYVEMAILTLVLNGLAQYGPAFAQLDRWIQIGAIGALLLGGGLAALFRREKILAARQTLAQNWRGMEP